MLYRTIWTRKRKGTAGVLAVLSILLLLSGCASSGRSQPLKFSEVSLASEPAAPKVNQEAKLIVKVDNARYAKQEAEVQLQINSKSTLPSLIDMTKTGDNYEAAYSFPAAADYTITIHMYYEDEHYSFAKPLQVGE